MEIVGVLGEGFDIEISDEEIKSAKTVSDIL